MFLPTDVDGSASEGESILICGSGDVPMSMLAAGLADRVNPEFAWAQCTDPPAVSDVSLRDLIAKHVRQGTGATVDARQLRRPAFRSEAFDSLVDSGYDRDLLVDLLRLPSALQGAVSYPLRDGEQSAMVLARVDALPRPLVEEVFGDRHLHTTLRQVRITLVVTFRGPPVPEVAGTFDRVFGVEENRGSPWLDASVWSERGLKARELLVPQPLGSAWNRLGLNPKFLPE